MVDFKSIKTLKRRFIFTKVAASDDTEIYFRKKIIPELSLQRMAALIEAKKELDLKLRGIPGGNIELIEKLYIAFDELIMDEFRIAKEHEADKAEGERKTWVIQEQSL